MEAISALEAMRLEEGGKLPLLDVRSPGEFAKGHLPGSYNGPILDNPERHEVGLTYKTQGQDAAVELGYRLVLPKKENRVGDWAKFLQRQPTPLVTCWRGGLRSGIAQEWLTQAGVRAVKVQGGYKALRAILLQQIEKPWTGHVIAGTTGSGKTEFLRTLAVPEAVDLEELAQHRGSSFGGLFRAPQPAQQTFENELGMRLLRLQEPRLILEDESRLVGRCVVPDAFYERMRLMPRVVLERPLEERVQKLKRDYVTDPLEKFSAHDVEARLVAALLSLRNRLGGADTQTIRAEVEAAFRGEASHEAWIETLLTRYYDPLYRHSMERRAGPIAFTGDERAVREWLRQNRR